MRKIKQRKLSRNLLRQKKIRETVADQDEDVGEIEVKSLNKNLSNKETNSI